jgi:hypothetical protein
VQNQGQRPQVGCLVESLVAHPAQADVGLGAAGPGDWCRAGIGLQATRCCETCSIITDFAEKAGTKHWAEPREADQDGGVGVILKRRGQCRLQRGDVLGDGGQRLGAGKVAREGNLLRPRTRRQAMPEHGGQASQQYVAARLGLVVDTGVGFDGVDVRVVAVDF